MGATTIGLICLLLLLILLFTGTGIGISLISISLLGVTLTTGDLSTAVKLLGTTSYNALRDYAFGVIPLFVLMGLFASESKSGAELYDAANLLLKRVRGGVAMATVASNAVFAAITGASIASAAVFSKISYPEMTRLGYDKKFSVGTIAGSSVLGMLIPPSILMIVYGSVAKVSIGKLFFGGIVPGLILSFMYCAMISVYAHIKPEMMGIRPIGENAKESEPAWKILTRPLVFIILILVIFGGMWLGYFTPTEAGGVGCFITLLLIIFKGNFTWRGFWDALLETGMTSGSILFLLISAQMFARMLAISGVVSQVGKAVVSMNVAPIIIILVLCGMQIALGCILDSTSIILLTTPIAVPVITLLGYDPLWYGIVMIIAVEMGLITPPFGISVFTVHSSLEGMKEPISLGAIFQGSVPFLIMMFFLMLLVVFIPSLATWLPNAMI